MVIDMDTGHFRAIIAKIILLELGAVEQGHVLMGDWVSVFFLFFFFYFAKAEINRPFMNYLKSSYDASPMWGRLRMGLSLDSPSPPLSASRKSTTQQVFSTTSEPAAASPPWKHNKTHCTANFCFKDAEQSEEQLTHGDLSVSFRISLRLLRAMTIVYICIINALNGGVTHLIKCLAHDKILCHFIFRGQNNIIIQVKVGLPYTAVILILSQP